MTAVTALDPHSESKHEVVEMLRGLLTQAEAGEYRHVLVMAFRVDDGTMHRTSAGHYNAFEVIAALACAQQAVINLNTEYGT